jgi:hypothetical protein
MGAKLGLYHESSDFETLYNGVPPSLTKIPLRPTSHSAACMKNSVFGFILILNKHIFGFYEGGGVMRCSPARCQYSGQVR